MRSYEFFPVSHLPFLIKYSLRSQKIGNVIQACVNESHRLSASTESGTITLSSTFAYKHPTRRAMIDALAPNVTSTRHSSVTSGKSQEQVMEDYVTTLTHGLTPSLDAGVVQPPSTEVVLVTGTTGALGAHFLAIETVYWTCVCFQSRRKRRAV